MSPAWISLIVFIAAYVLFVFLPERRSWVACSGAAVLVLTGVVGWHDALLVKINWNVMGLFFGTLILAELFLISRVPAVLAERLVDAAKSTRGAMLALCAMAGAISMFVENVAVVLLVAPVALSLAQKLKMSPVSLLIGIAVCSNLQGTATMIGDPPSMILASYMRMGFWDFFFYQGRAGIFFAIQIGGLAALGVLALLFRRFHAKPVHIPTEKARAWTPAILLCFLILGLSFATTIDPEFAWFAGVFTLGLSAVGAIWYRFVAKWGQMRTMVKTLDWDTTFFLLGVFILVGALSDSGWMDRLAGLISNSSGGHIPLTFAIIVTFAVIVSGFVDNVPFLLVMIPVVQNVCSQMQAPLPLLMFGLLIGACLGGNLTPIGASANVVTLGILKKHGHTVSFRDFMRVGIPCTVASVLSACAFVWLIWG